MKQILQNPWSFSARSCKILQDNALLLQQIARILQRGQKMQDLGRFYQEICETFLYLQPFLQDPCKVSLEDHLGYCRQIFGVKYENL